MNKNKNKETGKTLVEVVCLGIRQDSLGNKPSYSHLYVEVGQLRRIGEDEPGRSLDNWLSELIRRASYYGRPVGSSKRGSDIVGGVYEGYRNDQGSALGCGTWEYKGKVTDGAARVEFGSTVEVLVDELVLALVTADKLEQIRIEGARSVARDKKKNEVFEALEPVRVAYGTCRSRRARAIFVNELIDYLNRRA